MNRLRTPARRPRTRLGVELLEDRVVPAIFFGEPFNLGSGVNAADFHDSAPTVTADGLSLMFMRYGASAPSPTQIFEATRISTNVAFGSVVSAGTEVNFGSNKSHPDLSPDGLTLLYSSEDGTELFQATRTARNQAFGEVTSLGSLVPGQRTQSPSVSADGLTLFFTVFDNVQNDIYQATRTSVNDPWGNVVMLGSGINVPGYKDAMPNISSDGLKLFFNSDRPGGFGNFDLYVATRLSTEAPWEPPVNLGAQVNTAYDDKGAEISPDGGLLYFHSNRPGGFGLEDLYAVTVGYDNPAASTIYISDSTVTEGNASDSVQFTVTLSSVSSNTVTINYATQSGSAMAGSDFVSTSGILTFSPGQTSQPILVQILNDSTIELNESFTVVLSSPNGAIIADNSGVGTIIDDDTKFYVINDGSSAATDMTFEYSSGSGAAGENYTLSSSNTAPRGAASTAAGDKVWVVDANKTVYVYNPSGTLLGSWTPGGINGQPQIEGIATNGTDIWIVDAKSDKVYRYTNAASRLSGSQNAASSFSLNSGNKNSKGIVTDGTSIWTIDDATTDKVFKYNLSGSLQGSWTISGGGGSPTGVTLDPATPAHLWVVDNATDRVYQFDNAIGRTSGSQSPSANFALAAGNTNPQDIADPPTSGMMIPSTSTLNPVAAPRQQRVSIGTHMVDSSFVQSIVPARWNWLNSYSTFTRKGSQGRTELITSLQQNQDHRKDSVMADTLFAGVRRTALTKPSSPFGADLLSLLSEVRIQQKRMHW